MSSNCAQAQAAVSKMPRSGTGGVDQVSPAAESKCLDSNILHKLPTQLHGKVS